MRARASSSQTYDYLTIFLAFTEIIFCRIDTFYLRCRVLLLDMVDKSSTPLRTHIKPVFHR
jgi:hypothetical protein